MAAETDQDAAGSYASTSHPSGHHIPRSKPLLIGIVIVLLLGVAGGGAAYWWVKYYHKTLAKQPHTTPLVPAPTPTNSNTLNQYVSNGQDLNLSFTYPSNWSVTPSSNSNPSDQPITLNSPLVSITNDKGTTITGKVVVSIRPGSAQLSELASGNAIAAQASAQFAYTKPTSAQHQYPYLTFIQLAGGSNPTSGFNEVMVSGITSFSKGQSITTNSLGQLDPIISASFYQCTGQTCNNAEQSPVSITNNTWQNGSVFQQVQTLFASLQLR